MFENFTDKAIKTVLLAAEYSNTLQHKKTGTEHLLLALLNDSENLALLTLSKYGISFDDVLKKTRNARGYVTFSCETESIPFSLRLKKVLRTSIEESRKAGLPSVEADFLFLALLKESQGSALEILIELGMNIEVLKGNANKLLNIDNKSYKPEIKGISAVSNLDKYGVNLIKKARQRKLDPLIGRKKEIERIIQILGRRRKNNPILLGDPGVGKSSVVEGLAQRIVDCDVPTSLENKMIYNLDLGSVYSGTKYRGEFEERLLEITKEVYAAKNNIILVIDEIHTLVSSGAAEGAMDAANILKPALARGELQCLGATTISEYREHIEKDAALARRFQTVQINEPSVSETIEILVGLRGHYEIYHEVNIADSALRKAAELSDQYIPDRFLPDKAIDLLDEACSRECFVKSSLPLAAKVLGEELYKLAKEKNACIRKQKFEKANKVYKRELEIKSQIDAIVKLDKEEKALKNVSKREVTQDKISEIVSEWTGIPMDKITRKESERLLNLEKTIHERIIGQHAAVTAVSKALRRARVGLKNPKRPIASFLFCGPTGVGKTELTKALAFSLFGSDDSMVRIDMSEYMEKHTVAKLIGSPPGYIGYNEGGYLTEAVRNQPYTVILLDEIEKAHPDIFNVMLQVLEDGRLTDSKGRTIDFSNTLVIMTSNVGSSIIEKLENKISKDSPEAMKKAQYDTMSRLVQGELKHYFRPEFLNRLDETIIFRQLSKMDMTKILSILVKQIFDRLNKKQIKVDLTKNFKDHLIEEGFDPSYGARPLRRAISRFVEDKLAEALLTGVASSGDEVVLDYVNKGVTFIVNGEKV